MDFYTSRGWFSYDDLADEIVNNLSTFIAERCLIVDGSTGPGTIQLGFPQTGKKYPLQVNEFGQAYVEVPWVEGTSGGVDVVRVTEHKTSYARDTLEVVTDSTGKVMAMYFVTAS